MDILYDAFDDRPVIQIGKYRFIMNPLTEQIPATPAPMLREVAVHVLSVTRMDGLNKIVGEEDRGAILVAAVSLQSGLPLALARWNPSGVPGQVEVDFTMAYAKGKMYLNGVEPNDRVLLVDDVVSTGGTLISLVSAIRSVGASIDDIVCVSEIVEYGGVARVKAETGLAVKTLVKVSVAGERSRVLL